MRYTSLSALAETARQVAASAPVFLDVDAATQQREKCGEPAALGAITGTGFGDVRATVCASSPSAHSA